MRSHAGCMLLLCLRTHYSHCFINNMLQCSRWYSSVGELPHMNRGTCVSAAQASERGSLPINTSRALLLACINKLLWMLFLRKINFTAPPLTFLPTVSFYL